MQKQHKANSFVHKLHNLLKCQNFSQVITWDSSKTSIDILDIKRMEKEILPRYFRHQKFESFVRQLNLYGFKKIKVLGRHRFTHPCLLNGQKLTSIATLKCLKASRESKQTVESPAQNTIGVPEAQTYQILSNSMYNSPQVKPSSQQKDIFLQNTHDQVPKPSGHPIFVVPGNYFNFWNLMQYTGGQNMSNIPILTPVMPQQRINYGPFTC